MDAIDTNDEPMRKRILKVITKIDTIAPLMVTDCQTFRDETDRLQHSLDGNAGLRWLPFITAPVFGLATWYRRSQVVQDKLLLEELVGTGKSWDAS